LRFPFGPALVYVRRSMAKARDPVLTSLPPGAASHGRLLARPRLLAIVAIALLAALGWVSLGLMLGAETRAASASGASLLDLLAGGRLDAAGRALFEALCRPTFGDRHAAAHGLGGVGIAMLYLMWAAMTFAMMLPTAAPMTLAYADIAETAAAKREPVVSPLVLISGYLAVWLAFAARATVLQGLLVRLALLDTGLATASGLFAGAIFIGAGAYQFSALKQACLTRCQRPLPFFLANWTTEPAGVFRLGLRQGVYCLGCCWAMMLVMFAVGVMNVVWMALLGAVMGLEKVMATTRFSRAIGVVLIGLGAAFALRSILAYWPIKTGYW
jgi:predicted metal-binding membrane protein